jgi:hypothetical protein
MYIQKGGPRKETERAFGIKKKLEKKLKSNGGKYTVKLSRSYVGDARDGK